MENEDFDTRLEKLELTMEATQEVVLEQHAQFNQRIVQLEQTHDADTKALRRDLQKMSYPEEVFIASPILSSTLSDVPPCATPTLKTGTERSDKIPKTLGDLAPALRETVKD